MSENLGKTTKMTWKERMNNIGPTAFVAAAGIGPGSVATLSVIGASYKYALLWMLVFFFFFWIAQSDMVARLSLGGGKTLQEAIREDIANPVLRNITIWLIVISVFITCIIYVYGSIMGVGMGLSFFFPNLQIGHMAAISGIVAIPIILAGNFRAIENLLKYLILGFTLSFLITILLTSPNIGEVLKGAFIPSVPTGAGPHMLSLTGTTMITGYLFFVQSTALRERWSGPKDLYKARNDIYIMAPIMIGVSAMIMITAAATLYGKEVDVTSATVLGEQLVPLYGNKAKIAFAIGLFSAGFSSVIAAGMGPGVVIPSILGLDPGLKTTPFRVLVVINILAASIMAFLGTRPVVLVMASQALGALFLPIAAFVLLMLANNKKLMGKYTNSLLINIVGILAVLFSLIMSFTSIGPMISSIFQ
ncbi:NRAMP family divalent metal transporter [Pseudogracilibacillus sp. SO10305]|uniref:NRAMP family divalent metal transporter n=1 Tax=Pseudogracilibacillus sp. SO10305 TaxID=3098292 RepID=UPI00300E6D07